MEIDYNAVDKRLSVYFKKYKNYICCSAGCSSCCEKGDYPLSDLELKALMKGYASLDSESKIVVQNNIKNMERGGVCPFLLNNLCSIYEYRPIVCRIHGLAYKNDKGFVKLPYCVTQGKNFADYYKDGIFYLEPISSNLDDLINIGEVRNLYDWLHPNQQR